MQYKQDKEEAITQDIFVLIHLIVLIMFSS